MAWPIHILRGCIATLVVEKSSEVAVVVGDILVPALGEGRIRAYRFEERLPFIVTSESSIWSSRASGLGVAHAPFESDARA